MRTEVKFTLTEAEEVSKITFKARLLDNRLEENSSPEQLVADKMWIWTRSDMFWINTYINNYHTGSLIVESTLTPPEKPKISDHTCKIKPIKWVQSAASEWFSKQPEWQQQLEWCRQIDQRVINLFGSWDAYTDKVMAKIEADKR